MHNLRMIEFAEDGSVRRVRFMSRASDFRSFREGGSHDLLSPTSPGSAPSRKENLFYPVEYHYMELMTYD